jgi:hypothetical protein
MTEKDSTIIQVIQEMIHEGNNEQRILQNLRELGVPQSKAEKLLLLAQADVLPVLQSEINRVVDKKVDEKKIDIIRNLQSELRLAEEKTSQEVRAKNSEEMKEYEKYLETKFAIVQSQVNESAKKALNASDMVREKLLNDENRIRQLEVEGTGNKEMQILKHKTANIIIAGLGILFAIATAYLFYQYSAGGTAVSTESLIIGVVMGLIAVTLLFVSTLF